MSPSRDGTKPRPCRLTLGGAESRDDDDAIDICSFCSFPFFIILQHYTTAYVTSVIISHAHANYSRGVGFVYRRLFVFQTVSQKQIKLESPNVTEMFRDVSWKSMYLGWKSKVKVTTPVGFQTEGNIAAVAAYVSYAGFSLL